MPNRLGFSCFLVTKGLLCNLGSLSQKLRLLKFDRPKTVSVRAKTCLTGQRDRHLPVSYLQPWNQRWGRLNRSFNIVESVRKCWKLVESVLNQIQIGLNFHSTLLQHFLCSWKCWMTLKPSEHTVHPTFAQHLFNFCWTNVGQMLKPFKQVKRMMFFSQIMQLIKNSTWWPVIRGK